MRHDTAGLIDAAKAAIGAGGNVTINDDRPGRRRTLTDDLSGAEVVITDEWGQETTWYPSDSEVDRLVVAVKETGSPEVDRLRV
jgi:hypothetical protein